jgi:ribosomal protein L7/L12
MHSLPPAAIAALERGNLIEAIKLTREATGLDLRASKELVDRYGTLEQTEGRPANALPPAALAALQRGQVVEAVKLTREATGLGLKECKDLVDAVRSPDQAAFGSANAGARFDPLDEPGRVRSNGTRWMWMVVVLLAVLVGVWLVFRR